MSGDYCFYYKIDSNNNIDESDETNNALSATINVTLAVVDPLEPNNNASSAYNIGSNSYYNNNSLEITSGDKDTGLNLPIIPRRITLKFAAIIPVVSVSMD